MIRPCWNRWHIWLNVCQAWNNMEHCVVRLPMPTPWTIDPMTRIPMVPMWTPTTSDFLEPELRIHSQWNPSEEKVMIMIHDDHCKPLICIWVCLRKGYIPLKSSKPVSESVFSHPFPSEMAIFEEGIPYVQTPHLFLATGKACWTSAFQDIIIGAQRMAATSTPPATWCGTFSERKRARAHAS